MREEVGNFGRKRDIREKREEPLKRGKVSITNFMSSREPHKEGNRIPIGLETTSLSCWVGFQRFSYCRKFHTPQNK